MRLKVLVIGKTNEKYLDEGIHKYLNRIAHYAPVSLEVIADVKAQQFMSRERLCRLESESFLKRVSADDLVILLDDKGKEFSSVELSRQLEKWMASSKKSVVFIIGGAFGLGNELYNRADFRLSLSKLTFSHQMVRLIFLEQLYRAFTILRNESYHHD